MKDRERIARFAGRKILIIEKCRELREVISAVCSYWGASTIEARNSRDLVFQALDEKPDLIIFHPGYEKRNDFHTCKLLKNLNETRHIPILLTTAYHQIIDLGIPGVDDYLLKPFGTEALLKKMEKLFK